MYWWRPVCTLGWRHGVITAFKRNYWAYNGGSQQYGASQVVFRLHWQRDLTSIADIGENYNLPGGAHGSLVTGTFSLADLSYTDKPTAYISYFLETEGALGRMPIRL